MKIDAFDKFWYDCKINNDISILGSYDNSYRNMMYSNDYLYHSYYREDANSVFLGLRIFSSDIGQKYMSYLNYSQGYYNNINNATDELKNIVSEDKIVCPKVDLFFWNRFGRAYHKWTAYHYSLLVGYNIEEKKFEALEDHADLTYGIILESQESLQEAIISILNQRVPGPDYQLVVPNIDKPYQFSIGEFVTNSKLIINSINHINISSLFNFKKEVNQIPGVVVLQAIVISKIINRIRANIYLVEDMIANGLLSENQGKCVNTIFLKIIKNYFFIKNILIKGNNLEIEVFVKKSSYKIKKYLVECWSLEISAWQILINEMKKFDVNKIIY